MRTGLPEETFQFVDKPYHLQNNNILFRIINRSVFHGTESISFLAPKFTSRQNCFLNSKLESKQGLPANAHTGCIKNMSYGFT